MNEQGKLRYYSISTREDLEYFCFFIESFLMKSFESGTLCISEHVRDGTLSFNLWVRYNLKEPVRHKNVWEVIAHAKDIIGKGSKSFKAAKRKGTGKFFGKGS